MAKIFCFSSTGNSLHTAEIIAEKIDAKVIPMTRPTESCSDDVIGFVFPAYFWGLPKIVERFIKTLSMTNKNAYIFTVVTYGGVIWGVPGIVRNILKKKGLSLSYGTKIKSVENYLPGYKVNDSEEFQQQIDGNIDKVAHEIAEKQYNRVVPYTVLNKLIYSFFPGKHENCDNNFNVSPTCTGCGICQKVCPMDNIRIETGNPVFLHKCEHCLACIHACPAQAIDWKASTTGKQRYCNPHVSASGLISFYNNGKNS